MTSSSVIGRSMSRSAACIPERILTTYRASCPLFDHFNLALRSQPHHMPYKAPADYLLRMLHIHTLCFHHNADT